MMIGMNVERRNWPVYQDRCWGFLIGQDAHFVERDEAVNRALTHLHEDYRHVFFWWDFFLDRLLNAELLPAIDPQEVGIIARWKIFDVEMLIEESWSDETPLSEADKQYLAHFLNDWADSYVRKNAPDLDARRAIGGPLGRRLVARLIRPIGVWDVNASDRKLLIDAVQEWERQAREHSHPSRGDTPMIRIVEISGTMLKIAAVRVTPRDLSEWALRFPLWQRLLTRDNEVLTLKEPDSDEFWRDELPALMHLGVKVEMPQNWRNPRVRVRGKVDSRSEGGGPSAFGLNQIVQVNWQVMLGDQPMAMADLEALIRASQPVVRLQGQYVVVDQDIIGEARRAYERAKRNHIKMAEALRLSVGGLDEGVDLITSGQVYDMLRQLTPTREPFRPLKHFVGDLRPYQKEGVQWLVQRMHNRVGALLADDMGLGKTVEIIAALSRLQEDGLLTGPVLIVAPLSVVGNWEREFARFNPSLGVSNHLGTQRRGGEELVRWAQSQPVVVTTYDVLLRDVDALRQVAWAGIVADEAQQVKNPGTKRARAVRRVNAAWRVALTGTPVENRLNDLWAEMEFLNPGYLGSERDFRQRFERNGAGALDDLKRLLSPFVLRRMKTDPDVMPDLPDKAEILEWTHLTPEQVALYQGVVDILFEEVSTTTTRFARRGAIVAALTHLKQVTDHPALYLHQNGPVKGRSGKLERLEELISEILEADERVVVFSQYVAWVQLLAPYLRRHFHVPVLTFHGSLSKTERDDVLQQFNDRQGPPILLASLKAGGVGLNLASAQHVIHYDRWWNPATEDQATDRVWRMGQTSLVTVHKFVTKGTVEERIDTLIQEKRQLSSRLLSGQGGEGWVTELTNRELRELVELRESLWIE